MLYNSPCLRWVARAQIIQSFFILYVLSCLLCLDYAQGRNLTIHFVPHTHDDAGWLKTVDQYYLGSRQDIQRAGVEYILDTVVSCLEQDASRTFTYAEIASFERWWRHQTLNTKHKVCDSRFTPFFTLTARHVRVWKLVGWKTGIQVLVLG